jgi:hypothetical protein
MEGVWRGWVAFLFRDRWVTDGGLRSAACVLIGDRGSFFFSQTPIHFRPKFVQAIRWSTAGQTGFCTTCMSFEQIYYVHVLLSSFSLLRTKFKMQGYCILATTISAHQIIKVVSILLNNENNLSWMSTPRFNFVMLNKTTSYNALVVVACL